jgi:hypothetical protein
MRIESLRDGTAICGTWPDLEVLTAVFELTGKLPLVVTDPPYGDILKQDWDKGNVCNLLLKTCGVLADMCLPNSALYLWGGIGKPGNRGFFEFLTRVELETPWQLANLITWSKKRAYGVQHNYLFTREECAYLTLGPIKEPRCFNVPLLEELRGYPGFNADYPALSDHKRRTNVWTDINEIFQGKLVDAQKPERLYEIPIEIHTEPSEYILDPFAGSGTAALAAMGLGRKYVVVEKDPETFELLLRRIRGAEQILRPKDRQVKMFPEDGGDVPTIRTIRTKKKLSKVENLDDD